MVFHQAPPVDIDDAIIHITTYDVVIIILEDIGRVVRRPRVVEKSETMDEAKSITVVTKDISFLNSSV